MCVALEVPIAMEAEVGVELANFHAQQIIVPVEPVASWVLRQSCGKRQKTHFKVHVIDEIMNEDYLPDMRKFFTDWMDRG